MAKLQHTFIQGKMNKDLDERLVPNGQYRDAQNIQVSTSEGSDVGAVENILGNTIKNLRSTGPDVFWQTGFGLQNPVCIGVVKDSQNEKIYWFLNSADSSTDAIVEYDQTTGIVAPILVDVNGVLNFNKLNLITGVNILENQLFWTDDLNEPRVINIDTFKAGSVQSGSTLNSTTHVYGTTRDFTAADITVIKKAPQNTLTVVASPSIYGGIGTGITPITDASFAIPPSTLSAGDTSGLSWTGSISWTGLTTPKVVITAEIEGENGAVNKYEVTGTLSSIATISAIITIDSITPNIPGSITDFEMLLVEDEPIFKNDFPRFSYRYKYADGQYSPYAPFTNAGFVPGKFEYSGRDGFNIGMEDVIRKIVLSGFSTTPVDVDEVEVLYKNASSNNIYLIESFNYDFTGTTPVLVVSITSDTLGRVIESSQLLRLYDNVPQKAKAQEIVANRVTYGNYVQNYDVVNGNIIMEVDQTNTAHSNVTYGKASVKTDRKYQIGISFLDDYGRESPVFTSTQGSISLQKQNSDKANKIKARLKSTSTTPGWANSFKLYIKNNTPEYYNIGLDRYYDAIDGNVWLSFPSSERNKVQEGGFIVLKKEHNNDLPVQVNNRYKINSISNEAPESLSKVQTAIARAEVLGFSGIDTPRGFVVGSNRIRFYGPNKNVITDGTDLNGTNANFHENIIQGNYISFSNTTGGGTSLTYEIAYGGPTGAIYTTTPSSGPAITYSIYEIVLVKNLDPVDAWLTTATLNSLFRSTLYINENRLLPEFTGRFFVKINPNGTFINSVKAAFSDLAVPLIESGSINVAPTLGSNLNNNDVEVGWQDLEDPGNPVFKLPAAGSDLFNLAIARTDLLPSNGGNGSFFPEVAYQYFDNLLAGSKFKFLYSNTTQSANEYTIIKVNTNQPDFGGVVRTIGNGVGHNRQYTLNRNFDDTQFGGTPSAAQVVGIVLYTEQTTTSETIQSSKNPAIFETEPEEFSDLDIYYEASGPIDINDVNNYQVLSWHNCYSFGNGVESDRIRDDFNAPTLGKGVRVNSTIEEPYRQERRASGLIFSGIFNSISGINNTNQFLASENITKDLNPTYGSIQKLHARDTDLIALLEDKCFKILANKDALYNADGSTNVTANSNVLGQTIPFVGEYGISKNPESFASFGFRAYFTDKARGAVMRLSRDGLTDISDKGMSYFFQDALKTNVNPNIIGAYDSDAGSYNVVVGGEGVSFKEKSDGWNTRLSYDPEAGISLNNEYYTFKNGELYEHSNATRSNFYGVQEDTTVTPIFNDAPTSVKNFKTLSYEGDEGWIASIATNKQSGTVSTWKEREGIYFNYIMGDATTLSNIDLKEFSVQGIGNVLTHAPGSTTITINGEINVSLQPGDVIYSNSPSNTLRVIGTVLVVDRLNNSIRLTSAIPGAPPVAPDFMLFAKNSQVNTSGLLGYYGEALFSTSSSDKKELFAVNSEIFISSE